MFAAVYGTGNDDNKKIISDKEKPVQVYTMNALSSVKSREALFICPFQMCRSWWYVTSLVIPHHITFDKKISLMIFHVMFFVILDNFLKSLLLTVENARGLLLSCLPFSLYGIWAIIKGLHQRWILYKTNTIQTFYLCLVFVFVLDIETFSFVNLCEKLVPIFLKAL